MTNTELYAWLQANGATSVANIATANATTEPDVQALLDAGMTGTNPQYVMDELGRYTVNPAYVTPAQADTDAINALTAAICTPTACSNDVDTVLAASGATKDAWVRGSANMNALVDMLRCGALRTKLAGLGLDVTKLDGMLDSCDTALLVNDAMITHHGMAGV